MLCFNTTLSEAVPSIIMTVILSKAAAASAAERLPENCCQQPAAMPHLQLWSFKLWLLQTVCGESDRFKDRTGRRLLQRFFSRRRYREQCLPYGSTLPSACYFCTRVFIGSSVSHISLKGGTTYREQCFPEFYTFIYLFILPPFLSVIAIHPSGNVFSPFSSTSGGYGMFKRVKCVAQKQNLWCWRFLCLIHAP